MAILYGLEVATGNLGHFTRFPESRFTGLGCRRERRLINPNTTDEVSKPRPVNMGLLSLAVGKLLPKAAYPKWFDFLAPRLALPAAVAGALL